MSTTALRDTFAGKTVVVRGGGNQSLLYPNDDYASKLAYVMEAIEDASGVEVALFDDSRAGELYALNHDFRKADAIKAAEMIRLVEAKEWDSLFDYLVDVMGYLD